MNKKLPNLDPLRFIAASLVLLYHADAALVQNHYKEKSASFFPFNFGPLGVVLFFVLSGFLITWLLLQEKEQTGSVSIKKFYLKRILRIWPLYYLVIILSFLFFNNLPFLHWNEITPVQNILISTPVFVILLVIICPNIALLFTQSLGYANPAWSIGIEEQFYLVWPHIMKLKKPLVLIVAILVITIIFSNGFLRWLSEQLSLKGIIHPLSRIHTILFYVNRFFTFPYSFRIDAMATGALGAMMARYKPQWLRVLFSKTFQWFFYVLLAVALWSLVDVVSYPVFSILFIVLILNLALNKNSIISIENKYMSWLGQISYGIYLWHSITVIPAIKLISSITGGGTVNLFSECIICIISMIATVCIAYVSYRYFESPFLKIKNKLNRQ